MSDTNEQPEVAKEAEASGEGAAATGVEHLNLKVKAQDGNEVYFKVKKTTKLSKLMDAYCARAGNNREQVRFLFDGDRIQGHQTPQELDMEDEDEIDAMVEQHGGSA